MNTTFTLITDIILYSLTIPLSLFIYFYGTRSAWRQWREGKLQMTQKFALLGLVLFNSVSVFLTRMNGALGEIELYPGQNVLRFIVYTSLGVVFWLMFWNLIQNQKLPSPETSSVEASEDGNIENRSNHEEPLRTMHSNEAQDGTAGRQVQ